MHRSFTTPSSVAFSRLNRGRSFNVASAGDVEEAVEGVVGLGVGGLKAGLKGFGGLRGEHDVLHGFGWRALGCALSGGETLTARPPLTNQ